MALFRKQPRPIQFEFNPRYWDPKKEARKEREKRIKTELGMEAEQEDLENYKSDIRGRFRSATYIQHRERLGEKNKARQKMMIYIAVVFLLLLLVLVGMPSIERLFDQFAIQ